VNRLRESAFCHPTQKFFLLAHTIFLTAFEADMGTLEHRCMNLAADLQQRFDRAREGARDPS
jgi:hypothetical protein